MNREPLDMDGNGQPSTRKKGGAFGKIVTVLVILALAGVAAWKLMPEKSRQLAENVRQQVDTVMDKVSGSPQAPQNPGTTPSQNTDTHPLNTSGRLLHVTNFGLANATPKEAEEAQPDPRNAVGEGADNRNVVQPPSELALADVSALPPMPEDVDAIRPDRIDGAIRETAADTGLTDAQRASLPTVQGTLGNAPVPEDAGSSSDSVVTTDFISSLAKWLAANYQPGRNGKPGRSSASLAEVNMRYGSTLPGLRHSGGSSSAGREAVLDYAWSPGMLEALYQLYIDRFMTAMNEAARTRKQPLNSHQTADMLTLYAGQFQTLGAALRGVASLPDLHEQVQAIHQAGRKVDQAVIYVADANFEYERARDEGRQADLPDLHNRVLKSTWAKAEAEKAQRAARAALLDDIKRHAGGRVPPNSTLVYLAEWVDRRGPDAAPATAVAADLFFRLSERFDAQARQISGGQ